MQLSVKFCNFAETCIPLPISGISHSILMLYSSYILAVLIEIYQLDHLKSKLKKVEWFTFGLAESLH